jgi:hypothetical protein
VQRAAAASPGAGADAADFCGDAALGGELPLALDRGGAPLLPPSDLARVPLAGPDGGALPFASGDGGALPTAASSGKCTSGAAAFAFRRSAISGGNSLTSVSFGRSVSTECGTRDGEYQLCHAAKQRFTSTSRKKTLRMRALRL